MLVAVRQSPGDWKKGNTFNKGRKEDPGNSRLVSLTSVLGKIMERILLEGMLKHMQNDLSQPAQLQQGKVVPDPSGGFL